jgi:branched-chain amino acid transport system permease protein
MTETDLRAPTTPPAGSAGGRPLRERFHSPRARIATGVFIILALLALPLALATNTFYLQMAINVLIFIPLVVGQNLITGNSGQVAMGHAAFYGIGAYTTAILTVDHGWNPVISFAASALAAGLIGGLTGLPAIRIAGDYLFIVTIGLNLIFLDVVTEWEGLTHGASGIPGIPYPSVLGYEIADEFHFYYFALVVAVLCVVFALMVVNSRFGKTTEAVRDDPIAAKASGMSVAHTRVIVFVIGATMAGMSGSVLAYHLGFVGPQSFQFYVSLLIFEMAIIGGLGSVLGSVVGATLLVALPEILRPLQDYRLGLGGLVILILMVYRPQGLFGSVRVTTLIRR